MQVITRLLDYWLCATAINMECEAFDEDNPEETAALREQEQGAAELVRLFAAKPPAP